MCLSSKVPRSVAIFRTKLSDYMTEIYHQINNCMPSNKAMELTKACKNHEEMLVHDAGKDSAGVIMIIQVIVSMV